MVPVDPMGEHRERDWHHRFPLALDFLMQE
jgi:hypothetical protein